MFIDQAFLCHVHRGAHQCDGIHLAVAGLQTVEASLLDSELEVLYFMIVGFQSFTQGLQLLVHRRHFRFHHIDRLGGADTGDHIFTLCIHQVLAEQPVFTGVGIAGKAHAGRAILTQVTEYHGAQVDGGTVGHLRRDIELTPVVDRAFATPGIEYRLDCHLQLFQRIIRKGLAGFALDHLHKTVGDFAQIAGRERNVLLDAGLFLDGLEYGIEGLVRHPHRNLAEQLYETAIGIPAKTFITGLRNQALQGVDIEPEVEDGIHHARHGHGGTGAY